MKRIAKVLLLVVLALSLFIAVTAVTVSAKPIHVAGDSFITHVPGGSHGNVKTLSSPIHVAGD